MAEEAGEDHDLEIKNEVDPTLLSSLEAKGYSKFRCEKALFITGNVDVDIAQQWLISHEKDPNLDKPLKLSGVGDMETEIEKSEIIVDASLSKTGPRVLQHVNSEVVKDLQALGFPCIRCEKAAFFEDNLEAALNWLQSHQDDEDLDVPLAESMADTVKAKLTPEEAKQRARELQKKLHEQRAAQEKVDAKEKEKLRIQQSKMMVEAQSKLNEAEAKRMAQIREKEKKQHDEERKRQRDLLKREWEERHGKPYPEDEEEKNVQVACKSLKDQIAYWLSHVKKKYCEVDKVGLKTCLTTMRVYINNAHQNPTDAKYHKIKKENNSFKTKVAPYEGAIETLVAVGFKDAGEFYAIQGSVVDGFLCDQAKRFIDLIINSL